MSGEIDDQAAQQTTQNGARSAPASPPELAWENEGGHLRNRDARHRLGRSTVDELPVPAPRRCAIST